MANQTFRNIQDNVLSQISKSDTVTRNRIKNSINMGYQDFVLRELWPFREVTDTITTVAGTQEYALSTEIADIDAQNMISVAIQGTGSSKLKYMPFNQLRYNYPDFDEAGTGTPTMYYVKGGKIGFYLSPGDVYSVAVDYYKVPTEMSADADEPIIPVGYREALMQYALSMEHTFNNDYDFAQIAKNEYENFITKARINLLSQPNDDGNFRILGPMDFINHTDIG